MGKPTKKNIRRKNRRTRRKVNKKKMKKGGNIYTQFGNCDFGETNLGKEGNMIAYSERKIPIQAASGFMVGEFI